jgi:hypothetical protein
MADIPQELQDKLIRLGQVSETLAASWGKGSKSQTALRLAEDQLAKSLERKLKLSETESKALAKKLSDEEKQADYQANRNRALAEGISQAVGGLKSFVAGATAAASAGANSAEVYSSAIPTLQLMGNAMKAISSALSSALSGIPYVGALFGAANAAMQAVTDLTVQVTAMQLEQVQKYFNSYQALSKAGASFGGSLDQARQASVAMGLSMMRMQRFITENASGLGELGLGIIGSANAVAQMGKVAKNSSATLLVAYGTQEDMNAALIGYSRIMTGFGVDLAKNQNALSASSGNYLWKLKELTELTGMSAEQHLKEVRERQNNLLYQQKMQDLQAALIKKYGPQAGAEMFAKMAEDQERKMSTISKFFSPEAAKLVTEVLGRGGSGNVIDEKSIALLANSPELRKLADGMLQIQTMVPGPERDRLFETLIKETGTSLSTVRTSLDSFQNKGVADFVDTIAGIKSYVIANNSVIQNYADNAKAIENRRKKAELDGDKGYRKALDAKIGVEQKMDEWAEQNLKNMGDLAATLHKINMLLIENFGDFSTAVDKFGQWVAELLDKAGMTPGRNNKDDVSSNVTPGKNSNPGAVIGTGINQGQAINARMNALSADPAKKAEARRYAEVAQEEGKARYANYGRWGGKEFIESILNGTVTKNTPIDMRQFLSEKIRSKLKGNASDNGDINENFSLILEKIIDEYPGIQITSLNDKFHAGDKSKHPLGKAADIVLSNMSDKLAQEIRDKYGLEFAQFEKAGQKNANGKVSTGDHIHIQTKRLGGKMGSDDTTIVGEDGPEIVSGAGVTTSTSATSKIFSEMVQKLDLIARKVDEHKEVSEHILAQT